ncbi:MAG: hypothetical protein HY074_18945 [Deltaproteobacteria bacterium]|nr:hypothetical protein [Deltaproteobacteria bacterium]
MMHVYFSLLGLVLLSLGQSAMAEGLNSSGSKSPDGGAPPPCNPDPCVFGEANQLSMYEKGVVRNLTAGEKYTYIVKFSQNVQRCQQLCATAGEAQNNPAKAIDVCAGSENADLKALAYCPSSPPEDIVNPYEVIRADRLGTPECRYFLLLIAKAQSDETLQNTIRSKKADRKEYNAKLDLVKIGGELNSFEGVCTGALGLGLADIKKGAGRPFVDPGAGRAYCDVVSRGAVETRLSRMKDKSQRDPEPLILKINSNEPEERK